MDILEEPLLTGNSSPKTASDLGPENFDQYDQKIRYRPNYT